ncbi:MAG: bifunctional salicylyl-CoA 5-hydroxylase/oxidoreductase, partial [Polyangiaceae bacterium]|nr:bifunctional salicylyl-CoA 5-hydroxylase/oxidoreductase [Polyangiaceae bacterium]
MKIACIGGGPAGLYFSILMKKQDATHEIEVFERNRANDTFGFGVVFSDATLHQLQQADQESYDGIAASFYHWNNIDVHYRGQVLTSTGHGFSGMSRRKLLQILQRRALDLGVKIHFHHEVTSLPDAELIIACDGVNSRFRGEYDFGTRIDLRPNRFVWLGTTRPFPAFTFLFRKNHHGLFRVHAYQYAPTSSEGEPLSTFIVECTEATWRAAGLDGASEEQTLAYFEALFAEDLQGHHLVTNRSLWRQFPTIRNDRWWIKVGSSSLILMGDAAHTAHFSIGSGTKLAMEDAIALAEALALAPGHLTSALATYEESRRPVVEAVQRAAQVSLEWFEHTERYFDRLEPLPFAFSLLTRSLRITHENLKLRDPEFVAQVDRAFAQAHGCHDERPPMFVPLRLRGLVLDNRIAVSPMCQYTAVDGIPGDWHLVHLGSRAVGGAGLILTEMTNVSAEGRITPGCTGLYNDAQEEAWRRIVDFVHTHSTAKIGIPLGHAGRKASTRRMWEGMDLPLEEGNWPIVSASPLPYFPGVSQTPTPLDRRAMDVIRDQFVQAAERAERAGFDLLELHMAHGYLLASFLSPLTNRREDEYGGSLDNRLRWPLEVLRAVRAVWPKEKPISVRISATDWHPAGTSAEDAVRIAAALAAEGADILDVSTGQTVPEGKPTFGRLYQTPFADQIRQEARVPVMTVGNVSSWADANSILVAERADLVLLARGHLYDPYWTRHAAYEQGY